MARSVLHIDVGNAVTTAQALSVSRDEVDVLSMSFCPAPICPEVNDRTQAIEPVLNNIRDSVRRKGRPFEPDETVITVSAGGEPRTVCAGVVRGISGESAKRAALSAGATVTDLIAVDDGRQDAERISDLRRQDISMVVLAGGVDEEIMSSGRHQLFNIARIVAEGLPNRAGSHRKVPIVYAASAEGREGVLKIFGDETDIIWADNVRSTLEEEHLESARKAVVGTFSDTIRVDPRFQGLGRLGGAPVLPSGHAAGLAIERLYAEAGENLMGFSLDGDAVQVFSVIGGVFTRTVTPVDRVEVRGVARWLPSQRLAANLGEVIENWKMHPWILPSTWNELPVFLALWKEAIRLAIEDHKRSAIELRGIHRQRQIGDTFEIGVQGGDTLVKMPYIKNIVVTGILTRALSVPSIVSLILDGVEPCGLTRVYRDARNLLQAAGSLSEEGFPVSIKANLDPMAVLVTPGTGQERVKAKWAFSRRNGALEELPVKQGEIVPVRLESAKDLELLLEPQGRVDVGEGEGHGSRMKVELGFTSLYVDGRPRYFGSRLEHLGSGEVLKWYRNLDVFPEQVLSGWTRGRD